LIRAVGDIEIVLDIRGMGMIQGAGLVKDRSSLEPTQPAAARIVY
jgi:4-aminobutyrate aminotransferase-like enzyme